LVKIGLQSELGGSGLKELAIQNLSFGAPGEEVDLKNRNKKGDRAMVIDNTHI